MFSLKRPTKEASSIILNSRSNSLCINSTFTVSISVCWSNHFTVAHGARRLRHRLVAKRAGYLSPPRVMLLRLRPLIKWTSVGATDPTQCAGECRICAGCKSSLRPSVTWSGLIGPCHVVFDCSPHGSASSTGHAEAVVGITCPKPAGRWCWVATAGDCTYLFVLWLTYKETRIWLRFREKKKSVFPKWQVRPGLSCLIWRAATAINCIKSHRLSVLRKEMLTVVSNLHAYLSFILLPYTLRTPATKINNVLYTIMQRIEFSCFVPHFSLLKYKGCHQLVT